MPVKLSNLLFVCHPLGHHASAGDGLWSGVTNLAGVLMDTKTGMAGKARSWVRGRRKMRRFQDQLRADDTFFVGHPKSGNTWMAYMLAILQQHDRADDVTLANVGSYVPTIHAGDDRIGEFSKLASPRIFRNEGPLYKKHYPRVLYIVRDPRAVLVSYYHHCVHDTGENDWPLSDFVDQMLDEGCIERIEPYITRWSDQVMYWHKRSKTEPVHLVRYEDMKADCFKELRKVADFLELSSSDDQVRYAVERGDFSAMRKQEEAHGAESYPGEKGSKGFFVRKGKTDGWREELSAESIARIETEYAETMALMGYEPSQAPG